MLSLPLHLYPIKLEIVTRFSDVDTQHHINNVAIAGFYQESRVAFHRALGADERPHGSRTLVAHHEMDYVAEIHYPGLVIIGVGISRIGSTSYTLASAMFQNDQCVGLASTVLVHANEQGPAMLPANMRAALEKRVLQQVTR